ncbi:selenium metabolism protein YedF [Fervidicella metallireducens AeB]|uniref:Selenium metabolism protein YedF n=1 Tax=Fervidicella metallireducens AeB TaxID=1403537 RepID=A0A017RVF4_9CLOT|nr:sulfurtransferase-like selenium metabolism protein YedF [Fervidicella metallireducens]EYE88657.1 selenium metabolism protein YedF [Fervidicella metallireducens AeB]
MKTINCAGLPCPKPVIMTKKELENIENGELEVIVDNFAAKENVSKYAKSIGLDFTVNQKENLYYILIKKGNNEVAECSLMNFENEKNLVIVVGSDKLGAGDDKLGNVLMKSYIYALTESEIKPKTIMFLNGGVKLTTEGSEVLESLKNLESKGVEILSCGTCLDFYGLKDKLIIGNVTNMYTIIEKMNNADKTITI